MRKIRLAAHEETLWSIPVSKGRLPTHGSALLTHLASERDAATHGSLIDKGATGEDTVCGK